MPCAITISQIWFNITSHKALKNMNLEVVILTKKSTYGVYRQDSDKVSLALWLRSFRISTISIAVSE